MKHDQNSFAGRWMHFLSVVDPMKSFIPKETIEQYIKDIKEYERQAKPDGSIRLSPE